MEEEQQGLTIGEIFKVIFKRLWWVIGVTAAVMIIAVLFVQFIYNKNKIAYNVSYELVYPNSQSNLYPDGTDFRLYDIVSFGTLEEIKASDKEKFESINIESMASDDDISISRVVTGTDDDKSEYLKITVLAKYFKSNEQAADFLRALVNNPVSKINEMVGTAEYKSNLIAFDNADTYEQKIAYLDAQKTYLLNMYDELIGTKNEYLYYKVGDSSLNDYRLRVEKAYTEQDAQAINGDLKVNRYVFDKEKYEVWATSRKAALGKEKTENALKIEKLRQERDKIIGGESASTSINTVETFNAEIIKLVNANSNIEIELSDIEKALGDINNEDVAAHDAFDAKLAAIKKNLSDEAETLKTVRSAFYAEKSQVFFRSNKIVADGGISILLAALIGAVVGFVLVAIVVCIIDLPKYKREKYGIPAQAAAGDKPEENKENSGEQPEPVTAEAADKSEAPAENNGENKD